MINDDEHDLFSHFVFILNLIATFICLSSLALFFKAGGNPLKSSIYLYIQRGCKLSLVTWVFYGGVYIGKIITKNYVSKFYEKQKTIEKFLEESNKTNDSLRTENKKLKQKLEEKDRSMRELEFVFNERLKKYERTAAEANRDALKNFL